MSSALASVHLERIGKLYPTSLHVDTDSCRQCKACVTEVEDGRLGVDSQRVITEDYRSLSAPSQDDSDEDESVAGTERTNFNTVTDVRTNDCCYIFMR